MAIVTEDGSGKVDAETYVSVADANTYHTARGNAAWTGADSVKEAALREATQYLNGTLVGRWPGYKRTDTQALAWPRSDAYDREDYPISSTIVPVPVKNATAELALRALSEDLAVDAEFGGALERVKVGPIEEEYQAGAISAVSRPWIDLLLAPILTGGHALVRG